MMNCRVEIPQDSKFQRPELTVGREFYIQCEGQFQNVQSDRPVIMVSPPPTDPFSLKILGYYKKSDQNLDFLVTSYLPGKIEIPQLTLKIGELELKSEAPLSYELVSLVQEEQQKGVKVEPYGPFGPLSMNISPLFFVFILFWMLLVLGGFGFLFFQSKRRKSLLKQTPFQASLKPLIEFEKAIRVFQSTQEKQLQDHTEKLNQCWRVYWTRRFSFPAMFWSERKLQREFRRDHSRFYEKNKKQFDHFFGEMRKLRKKEVSPNLQEFHKLAREARVLIEKVDEYLEKSHSSTLSGVGR